MKGIPRESEMENEKIFLGFIHLLSFCAKFSFSVHAVNCKGEESKLELEQTGRKSKKRKNSCSER